MAKLSEGIQPILRKLTNNICDLYGLLGSVITDPQGPSFPGSGLDVDLIDGPKFDAFSRLRVATPLLLFDAQPRYGSISQLFNIASTAGGTLAHLPNESAVSLNIDTTSGASLRSTTRAHFAYQPGKAQRVLVKFRWPGACPANVRRVVGFGDGDNGIFLAQTSAGVSILIRDTLSGSLTENNIPQASWFDPLDGSGPSGVTADWDKIQCLTLDFQWPGRIRIGFFLPEKVFVHQILTFNVREQPLFSVPSLPIRFEIVATGAAGAPTSIRAYAASVNAEGGALRERGYQFSADTALVARSFTTTLFPVMAVRPATTFNSIVNRVQLLLESIDLLPVSGNGEFRYALIHNPTITGGSWGAINAESTAELNVTATAISGGTNVLSGHISASTQLRLPQNIVDQILRYPWVHDNAGNQIPYAIACQAEAGNITVQAAMQWRELR